MKNFIAENISYSFNNEAVNLKSVENVKRFFYDEAYFDLILNRSNGAFLFFNSLQLYGYTPTPSYHDIEYVNKILHKEYGAMMKTLYSFGQDIFSNQFVFSKNGIELFNIESGEREILADNFESFQEVLANETDYLTGRKLSFMIAKEKLLDHRLCAKKPFITGGDYNTDNLYPLVFPEYIKVNANIARQVRNLSDRTDITMKSIE